MSGGSRTVDDVKSFLKSCQGANSQEWMKFYDGWAESYEQVSGEAPMVELGFKHFVGVDGSQGMLDQAAKTGLYKELKLALLGTEPLPAQTGAFDVVIIVGALDPGFAPVSVVRELCHAAKPGGLVCMSRGDHRGAAGLDYKKDLERELQLMQEEGLWSPVGLKHTDRYMEDPHLNTQRVQELQQDQRFISGTAYLYKKALIKI
uniref:Methyltransferase domain-containing protein n=1 Tax=Cyclopterus lumpus TaxID=8103 RepID=A0A8C2WRB1_CYCLU